MKPLFVISSDWHIHDFSGGNGQFSRLYYQLLPITRLYKVCKKLEVPLVFCGDMFHSPHDIKNVVFSEVVSTLNKTFTKDGIKIYAIPGNHDQCQKNTIKYRSPDYINTLSTLNDTIIDVSWKTIKVGKHYISGIPYLTDNIGFVDGVKELHKAKLDNHILLTHRDFPNISENTNSVDIEDIVNEKKLFTPFQLVLSGHIHIPSKFMANGYMIGAPQQQSWRDTGISYGYWVCFQQGDKLKMVHNTWKMPEFKLTKDINDTDEYNYWRKEDVIVEQKENTEEVVGDYSAFSPLKAGENYLKEINETNPNRIKALKNVLSRV